MEVNKLSLAAIFEKKAFDVPRYQRAYDWGDINREAFWKDLEYSIHKNKTHFLGSIILNDNHKKDKLENAITSDTHVYSIVDGQQRFTTLTILWVALRQALKEREDLKENDDFKESIQDQRSYISRTFLTLRTVSGEVIRPRLYGTGFKQKRIKDALAYITNPKWDGMFPNEKVNVHGQTKKIAIKQQYNRFKDTYDFFYEKFDEKNPKGDFILDTEKLLEISSKISGSEMIEIKVSEWEDAIELFETVNARGKPLGTGDLLKNHFFGLVDKSDWDTIDKKWNDIYDAAGSGVTRLVTYFYITRRGGDGSSPPQALYENLKDLIADTSGDVFSALDNIVEFSRFYKQLNQKDISQDQLFEELNFELYGATLRKNSQATKNRSEIFTSIEFLRAIKVTQPQPMMFSFFRAFHKLVYDNSTNSVTNDYATIKDYPGKFLRQLEYFHFINNGVGTNYPSLTESLYQEMALKFFDCNDLQEFKDLLNKLNEKLLKKIDKRERFVENFCDNLYYGNGAKTSNMIMYSFHILERDLKPKTSSFLFPNSKTDASQDHWADQNDTNEPNYEKIRQDIVDDVDAVTGFSKIDSIGNLIPFAGTLNKKLGQLKPKTPESKSKEVLNNKNEYIQYKIQEDFFIDYNNQFKSWNSKCIDDRSKKLANQIYDIIEKHSPKY